MKKSSRKTPKPGAASGPKRPRKAAVFDLDGTLCDCGWRSHLADAKDFRSFDSLCLYDDPVHPMVALARSLKSLGYFILVSSGRSEEFLAETAEWLRSVRCPVDALALRKPEHSRVPNAKLKVMRAKDLEKLGYDIAVAYDDDMAAVMAYREAFPKADVCLA